MRISTPLLAALVLCMSGCASIVSGTQQSISVVAKTPELADVAGATCSFKNGKGQWFASAPGSVTVQRAYSPLDVHCDHPAWLGDEQVKSTTKAMAFGNILFGGVIGVGVDVGTGAAYDYPQLVTVKMTPRLASGAPPVAPHPTPLPAAAAPASIAAVPRPEAPPPTPVIAAQPALQVPAAKSLPGGQDGFSAGRLAQSESCHSQPVPVLTAKGPGFETYSVACANGDAIAIRCEFGNCRVLR